MALMATTWLVFTMRPLYTEPKDPLPSKPFSGSYVYSPFLSKIYIGELAQKQYITTMRIKDRLINANIEDQEIFDRRLLEWVPPLFASLVLFS